MVRCRFFSVIYREVVDEQKVGSKEADPEMPASERPTFTEPPPASLGKFLKFMFDSLA
jgi:hypothetical protein